MRHRKVTKKLGRNTSHRRALLRNLVTSLIMEERLETTPAKAKAMRPHVEKMITLGKRGDLAARRLAGSYLMTRESVTRLFDTVAPRFGDRNGGYLRIIHKGWRVGDGAATVYIELLGSEKVIEAKRAKRAEVRTKRQEEVANRWKNNSKRQPPKRARTTKKRNSHPHNYITDASQLGARLFFAESR